MSAEPRKARFPAQPEMRPNSAKTKSNRVFKKRSVVKTVRFQAGVWGDGYALAEIKGKIGYDR
jgi:hypothetical protein